MKKCQITYHKEGRNETVRQCYTPVQSECGGEGERECMTVYETVCDTRYSEIQPGEFVGDTECHKIPRQLCGAGCTHEEGAEECHDKVVTAVVDVPGEVCDLNPQKVCRLVTKLAPKLSPVRECTTVPKESCQLKYSKPAVAKKPIITKWCLDEDDLEDPEDERSVADPVLDTRRAVFQAELNEAEEDSLNKLR